MAATALRLFVGQGTPNHLSIFRFNTVQFVAWGAVTWLDPRTGAFDANNAVGFDIPWIFSSTGEMIDTPAVFSGGALGPPGDDENLRISSIVAVGSGVVFRLRSYPGIPAEFAAVANAVTLTNP